MHFDPPITRLPERILIGCLELIQIAVVSINRTDKIRSGNCFSGQGEDILRHPAVRPHKQFFHSQDSVERAGSTDSAAIRDALETVDHVEGLTCDISIREDHKVVRDAIIFQVGESAFEAIDTYEISYD